MIKNVSFLTETQCISCGKAIKTNLILVADTEEQITVLHQMMIHHVRQTCDKCYPSVRAAIENNGDAKTQFLYLGEN